MDQFDRDAKTMELGESPNLSEASTWNTNGSSTAPLTSGQPISNGSDAIDRGNDILARIASALRQSFTHHTARDFSVKGLNEKQETQSPDATHPHDCSNEPRQKLIVRSLKDFPSGYPNLATFLDSDESFMQYRRFGYLQSRLILEKQDELRCLEAQLDQIDSSEQYSDPDNLFTRECQGEYRKSLLSKIAPKFCEYSQLLTAAQQLASFNKPSRSEHQSMLNYVHNVCPVDDNEIKFVYCKEDLITLRPGREHAWLDRAIERMLRVTHHWPLLGRSLEWIFCPKESKEKAADETQLYYSKERIEGCSSAVITLMIVFMLILPIYLLYHLVGQHQGAMTTTANAVYMGILLVFTLAFAATMSFFTKARRHEILGAAAAYCAVLVVFLGNLGAASNNS